MDRPDVRYAHNGDVAIAYQVFGEGPISLVCVPGFISNLYWNWELPEFSRMLTGLGSFARVVILDRRGVGLSDRLYPKDLPSLEVVMDDVVTVMDEAGIERAAVFGWQSGATHAALLAATYPARVTQLVTFNLDPCPLLKPGWTLTSWGRGEWESYLTNLRQGWGIREWVKQHNAKFAPDATSLTFENWAVAMFQLSANPATAEAVERLDMETDIRAVLPAIHVPTLVLHRPQAWTMPPEIAAYVADQISSATVVAIPGRDDSPYTGDVDAIVDEVKVFLTGERHGQAWTASFPPSCPPTSSGPPSGWPKSATPAGPISSPSMTTSPAGRSNGTGAATSTPPGTACWRPSTGRPGPSAAPRPWARPSASSA
jgi:pimeloyl-ACP methyl ester carboxylesterase